MFADINSIPFFHPEIAEAPANSGLFGDNIPYFIPASPQSPTHFTPPEDVKKTQYRVGCLATYYAAMYLSGSLDENFELKAGSYTFSGHPDSNKNLFREDPTEFVSNLKKKLNLSFSKKLALDFIHSKIMKTFVVISNRMLQDIDEFIDNIGDNPAENNAKLLKIVGNLMGPILETYQTHFNPKVKPPVFNQAKPLDFEEKAILEEQAIFEVMGHGYDPHQHLCEVAGSYGIVLEPSLEDLNKFVQFRRAPKSWDDLKEKLIRKNEKDPSALIYKLQKMALDTALRIGDYPLNTKERLWKAQVKKVLSEMTPEQKASYEKKLAEKTRRTECYQDALKQSFIREAINKGAISPLGISEEKQYDSAIKQTYATLPSAIYEKFSTMNSTFLLPSMEQAKAKYQKWKEKIWSSRVQHYAYCAIGFLCAVGVWIREKSAVKLQSGRRTLKSYLIRTALSGLVETIFKAIIDKLMRTEFVKGSVFEALNSFTESLTGAVPQGQAAQTAAPAPLPTPELEQEEIDESKKLVELLLNVFETVSDKSDHKFLTYDLLNKAKQSYLEPIATLLASLSRRLITDKDSLKEKRDEALRSVPEIFDQWDGLAIDHEILRSKARAAESEFYTKNREKLITHAVTLIPSLITPTPIAKLAAFAPPLISRPIAFIGVQIGERTLRTQRDRVSRLLDSAINIFNNPYTSRAILHRSVNVLTDYYKKSEPHAKKPPEERKAESQHFKKQAEAFLPPKVPLKERIRAISSAVLQRPLNRGS